LHLPSWRAKRRTPARAALLATTALVVSSIGVMATSTPASSETTVSPVEAGDPPVVRDGSVDIKVDVSAMNYFRSNASAAFAATTAGSALVTSTVCRGDNPAGTNSSPRTIVTVTDPDGHVVVDQTSPVRNIGLSGAFQNPPDQPLNPQPAPSNTNYRGDISGNAYHGMSLTLDLTGRPAGTYTVRTTNRNTVKTGTTGACQFGRPGPSGTVIAGDVVETDTFVYRPWQKTFTDVLGHGKVQANISPAEVAVRVDGSSSGVITGRQKFYALDTADFALPADPETCATDPSTCVPASARPCDPDAGCTPRLMVVNQPTTRVGGKVNRLQGIFDLDTNAFIALAAVDGHQRTLMSLGPNDAYYHSILGKLSTSLAAKNIDLPSILATQVELSGGGNTTSLSLLNGLQVDPTGRSGGVQIRSTGTVQAGVLLDIYSHLRLSGPACVTNVGSSANGDRRYVANEDAGYKVTTSDLLPSVPAAGPLAALTGGPIFNITGDFVGSTTPLINTASAAIGVDTAADEPNGYPVWVEPFLSSPTHVAKPKRMDYLGTATWSASETPVAPGLGCISVDFLLGTGVAIFDNPLGVGFDDLMDPVSHPNAQFRTVMSAVDDAAGTAIDDASANPVVADVLAQVVGALPLSALP
jgi:hypothetical protein